MVSEDAIVPTLGYGPAAGDIIAQTSNYPAGLVRTREVTGAFGQSAGRFRWVAPADRTITSGGGPQ